ncbi:hypothetical protein BVC71_01140 [Marivivens niveibacter]|uniref:2-dehydro-3-deoxygalactonokinase n=1 Tax=Marivivens niveibacter TaxID=1930667 RepID=A0A251X1V8_9RHOB|nr:2-dehydro-3-deoxygalactonokinase [Marivivens niveibacter]OUD10153.1 hypothetical protein BVC71_01140 [Marivivens niveibacter]
MQWIAIDLTTQRAWKMDGHSPIETRTGSTPAELIGDWTGPQVIAGLPDAPVLDVPCKATPENGAFPRVRQTNPQAQLPHTAAVAGLVAMDDRWDGVMIWVTGQVHWIHVSAGEIISFQSSALPQIYAPYAVDAPDADAFSAGVALGLDRPERMMAHLAALDAMDLTAAQRAGQALGILTGTDLKSARAYWLGQQVTVVGSGPIADAYAQALAAQSAPVSTTTDTTLAGLTAVFKGMNK